jgi:chromate reductase
MEQPLRIVGFAGSLRIGSYNRRLLEAAAAQTPEGMDVVMFDLAPIPLYNADQDGETKPPAVEKFKAAITEADAVVIATPEYNHSIPGVLKNALDWASRPAGRSPLAGKPIAVMGAARGQWGTIRGQAHLRDVLNATKSHLLIKPEVLVPKVAQVFDENGRLADEALRRRLYDMLCSLGDWTLRLRGEEPYFVSDEE